MPKVSIVCITYNQEKYIAQAIESFLMQKTNFDVEIIISDDCSTDSTPQIIEEYAKKNPNIKPILREKNIGAINNYIETLALATGEYVIVNEGDDYFSGENKLQKQVEFLDANPDYTICFHPVLRYFENDTKRNDIFPTEDMKRRISEFTFDNLLRENFMQTNSVMYRWNAVKNIAKVFPRDILPGDWYLHLLFAKEGKIKCLEEVMSVYRIHDKGIWYLAKKQYSNHLIKHCFELLNFYIAINKHIEKNSIHSKLKVLNFYGELLKILKSNGDIKKYFSFLFKNFKIFVEFSLLKIIILLKTTL
ncbi:glycosyltransferase [bacterium]|nr:glycosyltransferase [bacterium]